MVLNKHICTFAFFYEPAYGSGSPRQPVGERAIMFHFDSEPRILCGTQAEVEERGYNVTTQFSASVRMQLLQLLYFWPMPGCWLNSQGDSLG
jgi:hypothetical protein